MKNDQFLAHKSLSLLRYDSFVSKLSFMAVIGAHIQHRLCALAKLVLTSKAPCSDSTNERLQHNGGTRRKDDNGL